SWYNRAGVERVMGFCTEGEAQEFLRDAPVFERMLAESGVRLVKLWLDISRREQARRLADRRNDPVKTLKVSALDAEAQKRWSAYSRARDEMLLRTSESFAPWVCVAADRKKPARLAVIRHLLAVLAPVEIAVDYEPPDAQVLFRFEPGVIAQGRLAK
ncbi:MAG: polyphosphate kinase 2, partial [Caulobacteraceae bacterium]